MHFSGLTLTASVTLTLTRLGCGWAPKNGTKKNIIEIFSRMKKSKQSRYNKTKTNRKKYTYVCNFFKLELHICDTLNGDISATCRT
jgi:hypothetical protein